MKSERKSQIITYIFLCAAFRQESIYPRFYKYFTYTTLNYMYIHKTHLNPTRIMIETYSGVEEFNYFKGHNAVRKKIEEQRRKREKADEIQDAVER